MRLASQALNSARSYQAMGQEAWALWNLGELDFKRDPPDVEMAEISYRQALAFADELGVRPLVAHCHSGSGALYQRMGKRQKGHKQLATAVEMYRDMNMGLYLAEAEAVLPKLS